VGFRAASTGAGVQGSRHRGWGLGQQAQWVGFSAASRGVGFRAASMKAVESVGEGEGALISLAIAALPVLKAMSFS